MRGNQHLTKIHYKGSTDDFLIFVESRDMVQQWKADSSIPLAQVVSGFKIFVTHNQGTQGILDGASKGSLEGEFGTSKEEEVVKIMLEKGSVVETEVSFSGSFVCFSLASGAILMAVVLMLPAFVCSSDEQLADVFAWLQSNARNGPKNDSKGGDGRSLS